MAKKTSAEIAAFGAAIRSVRIERGYSQESFAAHAGMDRSYYGAVERGEFNVRYSTIVKIADGLEVPVNELFRAGRRLSTVSTRHD